MTSFRLHEKVQSPTCKGKYIHEKVSVMDPEADNPYANWPDDPGSGVVNPHSAEYQRKRLTLRVGVDVAKSIVLLECLEEFVECVECSHANSTAVEAVGGPYLFPCCIESFKRRPGCPKPGLIAEVLDRVAAVRIV